MTSNRSFFKLQRELIRRNLILPVLSGVGFFFALPLFTLMMLQNQISMRTHLPESEVKDYISSIASNSLLSDMYPGAKLGIIIMASLAAFMLFRYLHSGKQVDFFHSLPISRGNLFVQLYLTGFMSVIPFYVIMYFAAVVCAVTMSAGLYITAGLIFKALAVNIVYFLLFYSIAVLSVILSGNTFISACIYALLNVIIPATAVMLSSLYEISFDTYMSSPVLNYIARTCFPFASYFDISTGIRTVILLIVTFIVSVILFALNKVLFTIRKSERAGSALSFYKMKTPLKCYLVLMCGYGFMFLFMGIASYSWRYVGIFFGVILAHAVFEALYNFDIRSLFKNWKTMIALLVVTFGFLTLLKADILGYDKKIPNEANISGVSFSADYPGGNNYGGYLSTFDDLTDAKNISTILKIAKYGVDNLDNELYNQTGFVQDENNTYINIYYTLKNGSRMSRHYNIPITDEYIGYLDDIIFTKEFIENQDNSIFDFPIDKLIGAEIDIRTQATTSSDISGTVIDKNKAIEIIKTLREESLTLTKEQAKTDIPVLRLDVNVNYYNEDGYTNGSSLQYVPVYSTYTKTLALIDKYANVKPEPLTVDNVASMNISIYDIITSDKLSAETRQKIEALFTDDSEGSTVRIDDVNIMSKILENAMLDEVSISTNTVFKFGNNYPFSIQVNFKNNTQSNLVYPDGKFPLELLVNIILGSNQ